MGQIVFAGWLCHNSIKNVWASWKGSLQFEAVCNGKRFQAVMLFEETRNKTAQPLFADSNNMGLKVKFLLC